MSDQISSVTNGITGCSSRRIRSSDQSSTAETSSLSSLVQPRLGELEVPVARARTRSRRRARARRTRSGSRRTAPSRARSGARAATRSSGPRPSSRRAASGSTSATRSRISRDAFQSLLARSRPCFTRSSLKRTSCEEDIASSPNRSASAPYAGTRRPPRTRAAAASVDQVERVDPGAERLRHPAPVRRLDHRVDVHVRERDLPVSSRPIITIRATQRKMMSRAVEITSVG